MKIADCHFKKYSHSWSSSFEKKLHVEIEDETLREGFQGAFSKVASLKTKEEILSLANKIGIEHSILGFPACSENEYHQIESLLHFLKSRQFEIQPWLLARSLKKDIEPILKLRETTHVDVGGALFIPCGPLRRKVEGWTLKYQIKAVENCLKFSQLNQLKVSYSLEDATRTPAKELKEYIELFCSYNIESLALCDTVGDCFPSGVEDIVLYTKELIQKSRRKIKIVWHGHNDRGLALANSLKAFEAGADIISGTFLGLGERSGNTPLEQLIVNLITHYGVHQYQPDLLYECCRFLAQSQGRAIPWESPLVGKKAFATSAGTHCAAIIKAKKLGPLYEDYVYSSVSASFLGRSQQIVLGPHSGKAALKLALEEQGVRCHDEILQQSFNFIKSLTRWITTKDLIKELKRFCKIKSHFVQRGKNGY